MIDEIEKKYLVFGLVFGVAVLLDLFQVFSFPSWVRWPVIIVFVGVWTFTAGIHAKGMWERGDIDSFFKWIYSPLIVVVLILDILFNLTVGTIVFRELPREMLFTTRVKRHYRNVTREGKPKGSNYKTAVKWAIRLNWIDPGHVSP
jgi:hypothetical protein